MFKIALIQNQSEMSHYGYADARDFLSKFDKYEIVLYTAQNINKLYIDINQGFVDSIIIASHAMNDITIYNALFSTEFSDSLLKLFEFGGGLLILHQLRLGEKALENYDDGKLLFLPEKLSNLTAIARKKGESPLVGKITASNSGAKSYLLNFPNRIDVEKVNNNSLNNIGLKGLYWHYWDSVDTGCWDIILEDASNAKSIRPLILSSKKSTGARIVVSSLTLDWQKQNDILKNLIVYIVEGQHQIAFIDSEGDDSIDLLYFAERLKSKKLSFSRYRLPDKIEILADRIKNNIHLMLIITEKAYSCIPENFKNIIEKKKSKGKIKIIFIGSDDFTVIGHESEEIRLLYSLQIEILNELSNGYLDGSFWSTIESLQVMNRLVDCTLLLDNNTLFTVFNNIAIHDRDGSYDGVFGATCALLWIRAKYLGSKHEDTIKTLKWLYSNKDTYEPQEKMLLYLTMWETEVFYYENKDSIKGLLVELLNSANLDTIKEMNAVSYLKCANILKSKSNIVKIIDNLCQQQKEGLWIDVATTASITTQLLVSRELICNDNYYNTSKLNNCLFLTVAAIQNGTNLSNPNTRPWDEKISINLKCIEALINFDRVIELPITEMINSIDMYSKINLNMIDLETSLSVLTKSSMQLINIRKENQKLISEIQRKNVDYKKYKITSVIAWIASILSSLLFYILILFGMYSSEIITNFTGIENFWNYVQRQWGMHFAFLGLLVAIIIPIVTIIISKNEKINGGNKYVKVGN